MLLGGARRVGWLLAVVRGRVLGLLVALFGLSGLCGVGLASAPPAPAAASAAAVSPAQGTFSGFTSQAGNGLSIRFRVSGSSLRDYTVWWRATCRSGRSLFDGTSTTRVSVIAGGWEEPRVETYIVRLPRDAYRATGTVIAHFRVLADAGRFTSPISATGVERLTATLYQSGRELDSCATGPVTWAAGSTSAKGGSSPLIVPANATIAGLTYAQWETKDWQWAIANLHSHHTKAPQTSACVTTGQQGPVWFPETDRYDLSIGGTITCHIPAGQYVFLHGPSIECSTVERPPFHATTDAGLLRCARITSANSLLFDGQLFSPSGFPARSGVFPFTMPTSHNLLEVPGVTHGRSAASGRSIILGPLPAGNHTVIETYSYKGGQPPS